MKLSSAFSENSPKLPAAMPRHATGQLPLHPELSKDEVHLWAVSVEEPLNHLQEFLGGVSHEDLLEAKRFQPGPIATRSIINRGILRRVLGQYVGVEEREIGFLRGLHGKPMVAGGAAGSGVEFSFSHSGNSCLCAVSKGRRLGVDIERRRAVPDVLQMAQRTFPTKVVGSIRSAPNREEAFLRAWTQRESCLKALGHGISSSAFGPDCLVAPGERRRLKFGFDNTTWSVEGLDCGEKFVASLVAEGTSWKLRSLVWTLD